MRHLPIKTLDEVDSTNDVALAAGRDGAPHGWAVAARRQTAGRGRRGHVWESPEGNLYLSVLLRPQVAPTRLPGLAAACGLGVLDGLKALGVANEAQLKWPNDLLAHGRKLAGILVEVGRDGQGGAFAVCGVGVNVGDAPRDLGAIALTELPAGATPSFTSLAEALRDGVVARVGSWASSGGDRPLDGVREAYLERLAWRGEKVVARSPDGSELARGTLETVDAWGRAVLLAPDGSRVPVSAERAFLRPA